MSSTRTRCIEDHTNGRNNRRELIAKCDRILVSFQLTPTRNPLRQRNNGTFSFTTQTSTLEERLQRESESRSTLEQSDKARRGSNACQPFQVKTRPSLQSYGVTTKTKQLLGPLSVLVQVLNSDLPCSEKTAFTLTAV